MDEALMEFETQQEASLRFASLSYSKAQNLGDEIQTLAAEQFLPRIDRKLDRDALGAVTTAERYRIILNGWFNYQSPDFFPPSNSVEPMFFGFHMAENKDSVSRFLCKRNVEYFKLHEPIGCRDKRTTSLLIERGIEAYYSKCLTLTFPLREKVPNRGRVFIVDADHIPIPQSLFEESMIVTQDTYTFFDDQTKTLMAKGLLTVYKEQARLVITTRLHCALPCIAMGIPVVFFGDPDNTRIALVKDLNLEINRLPPALIGRVYRVLKNHWLGKVIRMTLTRIAYSKVNWNPAPLNISEEKTRIIESVKSEMKKRAWIA